MEDIVWAKFTQNEDLKKLLLAAGDLVQEKQYGGIAQWTRAPTRKAEDHRFESGCRFQKPNI